MLALGSSISNTVSVPGVLRTLTLSPCSTIAIIQARVRHEIFSILTAEQVRKAKENPQALKSYGLGPVSVMGKLVEPLRLGGFAPAGVATSMLTEPVMVLPECDPVNATVYVVPFTNVATCLNVKADGPPLTGVLSR
jgi:hypothetical protein